MHIRTGDDLAQRHRIAAAIGWSMVAALAAYAAIAEVIRQTHAPFEGFARFEGWGRLRYVFIGVAAVEAAAIGWVRKRMLSAPALPAATAGARLQSASIVSFGLCEAVGILGFVLFLISGSLLDLYVLLSLALFLLAANFPRLDRWAEWAKQTGR